MNGSPHLRVVPIHDVTASGRAISTLALARDLPIDYSMYVTHGSVKKYQTEQAGRFRNMWTRRPSVKETAVLLIS